MRITTTLIHRHDGRAQIVAKANGKQLTTNYDHALSHERNHGEAAGLLLRKLTITSAPGTAKELENRCVEVASGSITHEVKSGTVHVFNI